MGKYTIFQMSWDVSTSDSSSCDQDSWASSINLPFWPFTCPHFSLHTYKSSALASLGLCPRPQMWMSPKWGDCLFTQEEWLQHSVLLTSKTGRKCRVIRFFAFALKRNLKPISGLSLASYKNKALSPLPSLVLGKKKKNLTLICTFPELLNNCRWFQNVFSPYFQLGNWKFPLFP